MAIGDQSASIDTKLPVKAGLGSRVRRFIEIHLAARLEHKGGSGRPDTPKYTKPRLDHARRLAPSLPTQPQLTFVRITHARTRTPSRRDRLHPTGRPGTCLAGGHHPPAAVRRADSSAVPRAGYRIRARDERSSAADGAASRLARRHPAAPPRASRASPWHATGAACRRAARAPSAASRAAARAEAWPRVRRQARRAAGRPARATPARVARGAARPPRRQPARPLPRAVRRSPSGSGGAGRVPWQR